MKLGDVDHFRAALERQGYAVSQIHKAITTVKTVYAWGQRQEIVGTCRLVLYRFKLANEARPESPAEYGAAESEAIIAPGAERAPTEQKTDPETVTEPSPGSAPSEDL